MRKIIVCFFAFFLTFGLVITDASAQRFGSGRSFGIQRSSSSLSSSPTRMYSTPYRSFNRAKTATSNNWSRWGGLFGGLLAGGLLASLFMGHGLGSGIFSWLILGIAAYFIFSIFRRFSQPMRAAAAFNTQSSVFNQAANPYTNNTNNFQPANQSPAQNVYNTYPADFDSDQFLDNSKAIFVRLQAAFDNQNISDLSTLTTPEMFAEIKSQLQERGNRFNKTDIITLDAQLIDVSKQFDSRLASVQFTGSLQENNEPLTQLTEIWHFCCYDKTNKWVVAGIQQDVFNPNL